MNSWAHCAGPSATCRIAAGRADPRRPRDLCRAPGPSLVERAAAALRRWRAELAFDSWASPAPALGMRSLRSPTRHLLFSVEGRDIDLRIVPGQGSYSVAGQVLGPGDAGTVALAADEAAMASAHVASLDELGSFRIDGVAPRAYVMTLRVGDDEIVLPPFDVGPPQR
jgi:hypothetical protein